MPLRRHQRIHLQNLRISVGARRHHFDERIGVPFLCECDDEHCHEFVIVPLACFDKASKQELVLVALRHRVDGERVDVGNGYELYRADSEARAAS